MSITNKSTRNKMFQQTLNEQSGNGSTLIDPDMLMETVGVARRLNNDSSQDTETDRRQDRILFSTPCGQTYWTDNEYRLYTNTHVQRPIGFWCHYDQCIYFDDGIDDTSDDDTSDDDEYDVPPTPPPIYEETDSSRGSIEQLNTYSDNEIDGETIVLCAVPHCEIDGETIVLCAVTH